MRTAGSTRTIRLTAIIDFRLDEERRGPRNESRVEPNEKRLVGYGSRALNGQLDVAFQHQRLRERQIQHLTLLVDEHRGGLDELLGLLSEGFVGELVDFVSLLVGEELALDGNLELQRAQIAERAGRLRVRATRSDYEVLNTRQMDGRTRGELVFEKEVIVKYVSDLGGS